MHIILTTVSGDCLKRHRGKLADAHFDVEFEGQCSSGGVRTAIVSDPVKSEPVNDVGSHSASTPSGG